MILNQLLDRLLIKHIDGDNTVEITTIEIDSRKVTPGSFFVCLSGSVRDGHHFIHDAVANGAVAILVERDMGYPSGISIVKVPDTRRALAILSDYFYGQPSHQLKLIGVTGTNGKTTITHLIEKILNDSRKKAGLIGTIYMRIEDYTEKTPNTTPESLGLQRYFKQMLENGAEYAVLEVSSHALDMGRVRGCHFKSVVFTNLTHDHLDYHQSMGQYCEAKSLLFSQLGNVYLDYPQVAILNADDPVSKIFEKRTAAQIVTYGIDHKADVYAKSMEISSEGTFLEVDTFKGSLFLHLKLQGKFNVYNVLAAISACLAEGVPLNQIKTSLETFTGVKGRFEPVDIGQDFSVIVDFAHNPDGLENVLKTAKEITKGKLYCVCGCEGDKDRKKRPIMARVALAYSDHAIFTSDNCRSEDPEKIIKEMIEELQSEYNTNERFAVITNRRDAIGNAIARARPNDCIVIAGRGHETHLIVKDQKIPFNDTEVAMEFITQGRNQLVF